MPDDDPQKTQTGNFERRSESEISSDSTQAHSNSETGVFENESPGELIGNFQLVEPLGAGGFGTVWLAEQSEPVKRQVALKMLNPGMNSREIVARFAQERQALAVMDHPGIARVYDAGITKNGRPFFVMELVRGVPLNDYCDGHQFGTRDRLKLFIDVCLAVQHAHQKGIIHRDLKPSNILVSDGDNGPQPKIIDFGIAKATVDPLTDETLHTRLGQSMGTPAYMSPEQALGLAHDLDTRADVYSLGVVLYQLLTGHKPFEFAGSRPVSKDEVLRCIRENIPSRPSTRLQALGTDDLARAARDNGQESTRLIQSVRGDLDWIVMKALEKERTRRYDTCVDFAADIRRHLSNEPVSARPPNASYLLRRFVSRHRGSVVAVSFVFLSLIAGLTVSTSMFFRESAARIKADKAVVRAQQAAGFLEKMLESVGPSKALGRDTTMLREILDSTADRVHDELGEWPDLEAELLTVLGNTYEDLDEYERALATHKEALRLRYLSLPPNDPLIAETLYEIANVLDSTDGLVEAETTIRKAIEIELGAHPQRIANLADAQDLLAWLLLRQGRLAEAEHISREMLKTIGPEIVETQEVRTRSMDTLGSILLKSAQFAESESIHRQALRESLAAHGELHPRVVTSINNLCHALVKTGKFDEVEQLANRALLDQQKLTGQPVGSSTDSLCKALAAACESRGDYAGAMAHLNTAINSAARMFGSDHGFCNDKRALLARIQVKAGLLDDAETTIAETRSHGGTDSAETSIEIAASQLAFARGNYADAIKFAEVELKRIRRSANMASIQSVDALQALAAAQLALGDRQLAEDSLQQALRIMKPELNAGMPMLVSLEEDLAKVRVEVENQP